MNIAFLTRDAFKQVLNQAKATRIKQFGETYIK